MAKRAKKEYTCTVTYTEGYEQRITEAFVELYYNRLRGITKTDDASCSGNFVPNNVPSE